MTFLNKSFCECNEVEKPMLVPMRYERLDDEEVEMVLAHHDNNDNNYDVLSNLGSDGEEEIFF